MTIKELYNSFNVELDKSGDIASYPSFLPEEKDYWLNSAITRLIKTRYSGANAHRTGFQQDQKRTDDLRTLVVTKLYTEVENTSNPSIQFPTDYWFSVGEAAYISFTSAGGENIDNRRVDILEATIENYDSILRNTLSEYRLNRDYARPIRLYADNEIQLTTDGNYHISKYELTYIKKPEKLDFYKYPQFSETGFYSAEAKDVVRYNGNHYLCIIDHEELPWNPSHFKLVELTFLPDHLWDEIVVLAVRLALANTSDNRYQVYSQESQVIE